MNYVSPSDPNGPCPLATASDQGKFAAEIDLPSELSSGTYDVEIQSSNSSNLHQVIRYSVSATNPSPFIADLPAGDIDKDPDPELRIDLTDWNILRECKRKTGNPASCSVGGTEYKTDLNDDGKTDEKDMNLFVREFFYRNE